MDNAEEQRTLLRQAMNAFSGNAPTYRITLFFGRGKNRIVCFSGRIMI